MPPSNNARFRPASLILYETAGSRRRRTAIVHDITINDHISYIEWVHVTVYSQI